jgi:hypothetical protein
MRIIDWAPPWVTAIVVCLWVVSLPLQTPAYDASCLIIAGANFMRDNAGPARNVEVSGYSRWKRSMQQA